MKIEAAVMWAYQNNITHVYNTKCVDNEFFIKHVLFGKFVNIMTEFVRESERDMAFIALVEEFKERLEVDL